MGWKVRNDEKFYEERGSYGICPVGLRCCTWHTETGEPCFIANYYGVCPQKAVITPTTAEDHIFLKKLKKKHPDLMMCEIAQMKVWDAPTPTKFPRMVLVHNIADNTMWRKIER